MELQTCYFCENKIISCMTDKINDIIYCEHCEIILGTKSLLSLQNNEISECIVCLESKMSIKLPNCIHKLCLDCCKNIYLGYNSQEKPIDYKDINHDTTEPFNLNDDLENDPERQKMEEYELFEDKYLNYDKSYEELINIRNSLIINRPDWMNTENFIDWENRNIQYFISAYKFDNLEDNKKANANPKCPYCRQ